MAVGDMEATGPTAQRKKHAAARRITASFREPNSLPAAVAAPIDDDELLAAAPSDTLAALDSLSVQFGSALRQRALPPLATVSQLYSVVKNRTEVRCGGVALTASSVAAFLSNLLLRIIFPLGRGLNSPGRPRAAATRTRRRCTAIQADAD